LIIMIYPIPVSPQEVVALRQNPVSEDLIASAIAGVVAVARAEGRSLEELLQEVLTDDRLLDSKQRQRLGEIVKVAWERLI
jgi:ketopantoate reductase